NRFHGERKELHLQYDKRKLGKRIKCDGDQGGDRSPVNLVKRNKNHIHDNCDESEEQSKKKYNPIIFRIKNDRIVVAEHQIKILRQTDDEHHENSASILLWQ